MSHLFVSKSRVRDKRDGEEMGSGQRQEHQTPTPMGHEPRGGWEDP